jgi:hypothetical protein
VSAWRREALVALPEFKQLIAACESPVALWIELHLEFKRAFEASDASRVRRVMEYAKWCWDGRDSDTVNAVACGFLEHLPDLEGIRARIPEWFNAADFERLRPVFAYHAGNEAVAEIEKLYRNPSRRSHS